ncbi:hypothetical protein AL073_05550 [Loktanella sp. 1ANDIMAR09]|nr:hypothetical protein AL073_05550 [Loktanella sp. 1ANDIMAR09]
MFKNMKLCASVVSVVVLAGCGGGGGASGPSFEELSDEFVDIAERSGILDVEGVERYNGSDLPVTGGANYNGVISNFDDFALLGDLQMTASFSDNTISGGADNFSDSDGDTYTGRIPITNGMIFRDDDPDFATFETDFDGELVYDPTGEVLAIDTFMQGDFYGDQYEFAAGIVTGTISADGDVLTVGTQTDGSDFFSVFVAER